MVLKEKKRRKSSPDGQRKGKRVGVLAAEREEDGRNAGRKKRRRRIKSRTAVTLRETRLARRRAPKDVIGSRQRRPGEVKRKGGLHLPSRRELNLPRKRKRGRVHHGKGMKRRGLTIDKESLTPGRIRRRRNPRGGSGGPLDRRTKGGKPEL